MRALMRSRETGHGLTAHKPLTAAAMEFLLRKGTAQRYGAQRLKLAIERHIVYPLANLLVTDQIHVGDMVRIDRHHNEPCLNFIRKVKDLVTPLRCLEPEVIAASVPTNIGESVEVVAA
jgi:ATP-dependent Clp protease ATP-binding subunit ClpA